MFAQCLQKVQGKNRRRPHTPDSQAPNHSQRYLEHALQVFQQYEPASLRVDVFDHLKLNGQAKKLNSCVTCCSCGQLTEVALPDRRRRTCKRSAQKNESLPCGSTLESNARRLAVKSVQSRETNGAVRCGPMLLHSARTTGAWPTVTFVAFLNSALWKLPHPS